MLAETRRQQDQNDRLVQALRSELADRDRAQDRLVEAARIAAVGELAASVAHEVNNPLTGVLGYAELLLLDLAEGDPRRRDVEIIRDEALRAGSIVRGMREFARSADPDTAPPDQVDSRPTTGPPRSPSATVPAAK